jgi:hypothetical protein
MCTHNIGKVCKWNIDLSMFYLTRLSVAQSIRRRMAGLLTNNELERMWKEAIVTWCEVLSRYLSGGTEDDHEEPVEIVYLRTEIRFRRACFQITKQECCPLDGEVPY